MRRHPWVGSFRVAAVVAAVMFSVGSLGCRSTKTADAAGDSSVATASTQPAEVEEPSGSTRFVSEAVLVVSVKRDEAEAADTPGDLERVERVRRNLLATIQGDEHLTATLARPAVRDSDWYAGFDGDDAAAVADLQQRLDGRPIPQTTLVSLRLTMGDLAEAQAVLDAVVRGYLDRLHADTEAKAGQLVAALRAEQDELNAALAERQAELDALRAQENGRGGNEAALVELGTQMQQLRKRLAEAEFRIEEAVRFGEGATRVQLASPPSVGERVQ